MIPKASQRGLGQDLATHLLNAADNEYVEVAEVSGAVATDLHGAFAEWEVLATSLTKCREYLYSVSVNPEADQHLTRAQYLDYAERVEKKLGLQGQPRAMVFHIKEGREHCHIVWSRIDWRTEKAVHLAFDHEKLMMVSREFARDHGLQLPDGYSRDGGRGRKQSLYESRQEKMTGLSKEERMVMVTQAFRQSDSARSFVRALEAMGYVLATGKRPYVLVDMYGGMNALPKLIDDRSVRTKDIRAFLERDFPTDQLPSVEEARGLVAELRQAREQFAQAQGDADRLAQLQAVQDRRRSGLVTALAEQQARHQRERASLEREQLAARRAQKAQYLAHVKSVRAARAETRPTGLAAFLGRVTGVSLVIGKLHRHRDAKAYRAFAADRQELLAAQKQAALSLRHGQTVQALDTARQLAALAKVEVRERQALEVRRVREQRIIGRHGHEHMPALSLELKPKGRGASVRRAKDRYRDRTGREDTAADREVRQARIAEQPPEEKGIDLRQALQDAVAREEPWPKHVDLAGDFARAAGDGSEDGGDGGGEDVVQPRISRAERKSDREKTKKRGRDDDFEREI